MGYKKPPNLFVYPSVINQASTPVFLQIPEHSTGGEGAVRYLKGQVCEGAACRCAECPRESDGPCGIRDEQQRQQNQKMNACKPPSTVVRELLLWEAIYPKIVGRRNPPEGALAAAGKADVKVRTLRGKTNL